MSKFFEKIKKIASENKKVAMFVDMDGTITVYDVYPESDVNKNMADNYQMLEPVNYVIDILRKINEIPNVDVYILTLSRDRSITEEKKIWLNKYVNFIDEDKWIIVTKELGEYNKENRDTIKAEKMKEKLNKYNYEILLDDDHKILKETQKILGNNASVFHISAAIIYAIYKASREHLKSMKNIRMEKVWTS